MIKHTLFLALVTALLLTGLTRTAHAQATPAVSAQDQTLGSDNSVTVAQVVAAQDGWIVIHESNPDGSIVLPGIIGKTPVKAGENTNVKITLDKQVADGAKLWPMLHIDAGVLGTYEFPGADTPVTVNGNIVMVSIRVRAAAQSSTPMVMAQDQTLGGDNSVTVAKIVAAQDGWIVIHESNPDGSIVLPGIIGKTPVKAGENSNVKIMLDKQVANGAKLWPMLHIDAGVIGTYEFPGADTPVTVNGNIVMVSIMVTTAAAAAQPTAGTTPASLEPSVTAGDQTGDSRKVVVGMVVADQDGWIVIHESNPDGSIVLPGIIGKTYVKRGMTHNVEIVLDKQVANGAKLWAMLHIDAGVIGTYEFPGSDTPVTFNGNIVMMPFVLTTTPGMPTTGAGDGLNASLLLVATLALGVLGAGVMLRRRRA